jgi:hypothetical protein
VFGDNPDLYPTPAKVALKMLARVSKDAVNFLEPSAGKGDLADIIKRKGEQESYGGSRYNRFRIDCIEIEPDLVAALRGKEYTVVGHDWLTYSGVSYYDCILANPPFSNGDEHLLKMWDFMWDGEIVCLLNQETINNPHTERRQRLVKIIMEHGDVTPLGQCFRDGAQRPTDVSVAMVYLRKKSDAEDLNDLWRKEGEEKRVDDSAGDDQLERMLAVPDLLGNLEHYYNSANEHMLKAFNHLRKAHIYRMAGGFTGHASRDEHDHKDIVGMASTDVAHARAEWGRSFRRDAWMSVFDKMQFHKWLDSKQREQFLRDVQKDANIPFTADNIKGTLENVISQRKRLFEQSCANVFDELTKHFDGNTVSEGWKTNDNFKVNERLVFPYGVRYEPPKRLSYPGYHGNEKSRPHWSMWDAREAGTIQTDLDRILCVLEGKPFEKCHTVLAALDHECRQLNDSPSVSLVVGGAGRQTWSQHFEIRFFKKGTVHLKFQNTKLWERFNCACAAGKLWLGMNTNGRDEFPGRRTYYRHGKECEIKTPPMPADPMAMIFALRKEYSGVAEPERQIADVPPEPAPDMAALPSGAFTQDEPIDMLALAQASFFSDLEAL